MLSRKETVSVILIITAVVCLLNAFVFGNILPAHISLQQLGLKCISTSTAYICMLYALSTWFFHSNYSRPRRHMRLVLITMLIVLLLLNVVASYFFVRSLRMSELKKSTKTDDIFSDFDVICRSLTLVLSILTMILLFVTVLIVGVKMLQKQKKRERKRRSSQTETMN